jgi:DNA repair photolyase
MGVLTDPFMEEERKYRCTYQMLELFKEHDVPVIITTKGIVCADSDYIDLLKSMKVIVQFSLNTLNHKLSKKLESKAPAPLSRIRAMELLSRAGVTTQLRLDPIIPFITDGFIDVAEVVNRAWSVGTSDVIVRYLKIFNFKRFYERMNKALGFDYMAKLKENNYPLEKEHDYYRTATFKMKEEMEKIKRLTESYGMGFYNPIFLGMQDFKPCCGFSEHIGDVGSPWALYSHVNSIDSETTFTDYISNTNCPYSDQFERLWNDGNLEKFFSDLKFNNKKGTYNRIKQEVL